MIYVLANRKREGEKKPPFDGKSQIWRVSAKTGDSEPMTQVEGGIEAFQSPRSRTTCSTWSIAIIRTDDFKALREKFDQIEYGQGKHQTSQIWKFDLRLVSQRRSSSTPAGTSTSFLCASMAGPGHDHRPR